ncbi:MAG: FtsW/RodA/SpoVE family cell cycle protein [Phycisphaerales bacterium JB050]
MIKAGDVILLCVLSLLCIGVLMVNSASLSVGSETGVTFQSIALGRSTQFAAIAFGLLLFTSRLPVRKWATTPWLVQFLPLLVVVSLGILTLVYVPSVARQVNGSQRWIGIPGTGLTMQPSEIAKWCMPLVMAWYCSRHLAQIRRFWSGLLPALVVLGIVTAVVTHQDLGTGALIFSAGCLVLLAGGAKLTHFLALAPLPLAGLVFAIILEPYRVKRLTTFMNPYADPDGSGYHMIQSLVAVANGEGFGRGIGFGLQKFGYLPEDRTDFLFAVICEELGIAGVLIVLTLYSLILLAGLRIVQRETHVLLKLAGLGFLATLGLQACINLTVVVGLAPTKGIALPLLSSGGTGWILTAGALGALISIDRSRASLPETDTASETAAQASVVVEHKATPQIDSPPQPALV